LKRAGTVAKIGVSAYDRAQIDLALDRLPLDTVQVPVNLLDQRLLQDGTLDRLERGNVEIHARSAFLQGALLADPANLPAHFARHLDRLRAIGAAAERAGLSRLALCLRFVLAQPAVDRVIVGVTSLAELRQVVDAATEATPLPDGLATLASDDPHLVNPSLWPA
jgi:aryl-alcohol dehydrogenase-like predicted oxidoreductase